MKKQPTCPHCGDELAADTVGGVCPKCLLKQGLAQSDFDACAKTVTQEPENPGIAGEEHAPRDGEAAPTHLRYFGDYEILDEIARGGMGIVYKARQVSLNRIVAVKVILSGELASATEVKRFYTEAEAAANLQHPNIVAIHEVGEHGRHYFSMDYVEGTDLDKQLRQGPLDPLQAAAILKKITQAVGYAHMQGTLHRDLKPSNVLLDANGEPHITDFGLAKRSSDREGITLSGTVLGTPSYMAPEQASGRIDKIDGRTDVYGLGAVLFAMLTGKPPFTGATALAVMRGVTDTPPTPPSKLNPKVPVAIETICLKCLEKNPENRYASAIDLAADLNRFLLGQPIVAQPASALMRVMDRLRQNPWIVTGFLSLLVLLLLLGSYTLWDYAQFAMWKAGHPGQKPAAVSFENILGLPTMLKVMGLVSFFAYMVLAPIFLYMDFAECKRKGQLAARKLTNFAALAVFNMALAIVMMCRLIHLTIWRDGKSNDGAVGLVAMLLPAFWFGAHSLWLAVVEWRGRHFGEKPDEAKAVYGAGWNLLPRSIDNSRASGNLNLALLLIFCVTNDLLGLEWVAFGIGWFLMSILFGLFCVHREILAWKRESRVSNQVFWFWAMIGTGFLVFFLNVILREVLQAPAKGILSLSIAFLCTSTAWVWSKQLDKSPRPPRFWNVSRFHRWLIKSGVGPVVLNVIFYTFAWFSNSFDWLLASFLAGHITEDLLEIALTPEPRRKAELGITLGLGVLTLLWLHGYSRPPAFGFAIALGLTLSCLMATVALLTTPAPNRPIKKWLAIWGMTLTASVAAAFLYFPNIATLTAMKAAMPEFASMRMSIHESPEKLRDHGDKLVRSYVNIAAINDGIAYFKRLASRSPESSPEAFKAHWAVAELLRQKARSADASKIYDQMTTRYDLVQARHWSFIGPFPASAAPQPSELPEFDKSPSWRNAHSAAVVFSGYLDLKPMRQSGALGSARQVFFGRLRIVSPVDQEVSLRLGLTGDATGWLNGNEILRARNKDYLNLDNVSIRTTLQKGENIFLLRMIPAAEFPALILRFLDLGGHPVPSLRFAPPQSPE